MSRMAACEQFFGHAKLQRLKECYNSALTVREAATRVAVHCNGLPRKLLPLVFNGGSAASGTKVRLSSFFNGELKPLSVVWNGASFVELFKALKPREFVQ